MSVEINDKNKYIHEKEVESRSINKEIKLHKEGKCPECKRNFDNPEDKIKELEKDLSAITSLLETLSDELDVLNKEKNKSSNSIMGLDDLKFKKEGELQNYKSSLDRIKYQIKTDNSQIKTIEEKKKDYDIAPLEEELDGFEDKYKKDFTMYNRMRRCEVILSESGIRSYIIRKYLPMFNQSLKKYLNIMEANFNFEFDAEFNQKLDGRVRSAMEYESLSSGQKSRVSLAILFSFIEFAEKKSGSRINILIMDEIIDGLGLDEQGKESVLNILQHNIKKKMMIISHDRAIAEHFDSTLKVSLQGNFSHVELT